MSQSAFAGLLLLVSAHVAPSDRYHVRSPTYACVDPQAALALNDPGRRSRWRRVAHQEDRCFRVRPRERWEQIAHPTRSLLLLRKQPPHPGEPPLYFRSSTVALARLPRAHRRRLHHALTSRDPAAPAERAVAGAVPGRDAVTPAAIPQRSTPPGPSAAVPARPSGSPTVPVSAAVSPPPQAAGRVPAPAPRPAEAASAAARPVIRPGGFVHRFSPLLVWAVVVTLAMLLVRLVRRRRPAASDEMDAEEPLATTRDWSRFRFGARRLLGMRQGAAEAGGPPPAPSPPAEAAASGSGMSAGEYKSRCVARLRHAGWDARTRFSADAPGPHVIASHGGLVLALQCHPSVEPVDIEAVEDACLVRERQCSDLAAVVSNAPFTEPARQLAARTGIVLLHEDQLASLAV